MPARKSTPNDTVMTKKQLIAEVSEKLRLMEEDVAEVILAYEDVVIENLLKTGEDKNMIIQIFDGIRIIGTFIPEHYHEHPYTKKPTFVEDKMRFNASFTKTFKERINTSYRESRVLLKKWYATRTETQLQQISDLSYRSNESNVPQVRAKLKAEQEKKES